MRAKADASYSICSVDTDVSAPQSDRSSSGINDAPEAVVGTGEMVSQVPIVT